MANFRGNGRLAAAAKPVEDDPSAGRLARIERVESGENVGSERRAANERALEGEVDTDESTPTPRRRIDAAQIAASSSTSST